MFTFIDFLSKYGENKQIKGLKTWLTSKYAFTLFYNISLNIKVNCTSDLNLLCF